MSTLELFKQGAEGRLYKSTFDGKLCLIKERFVKSYRHLELDTSLTKSRIKAESKTVKRCEDAGILVPKIFKVDLNERKIYLEYFDKSLTAKQYIEDFANKEGEANLEELATRIGEIIGKMHKVNIIHGDLTTSNILLNPKENEEYDLIMIDFGLSSYSTSTEDKAVDLYVLERALLSTHSSLPQLFEFILKSYKSTNDKSSEIIAKFEDVRARGRKRTMVG